MNDAYWFTAWLKQHRAKDSASLRRVLHRARNVDALITAAPDPRVSVRDEPSDFLELTGGKGVDLTGELGCHHIDCLAKEIHGLFRHAWHYFDRIILPDQALFAVVEFQGHRDIRRLIDRLSPFVQVLTLIEKTGGGDLVRFETRAPSCRQHFEQHAREAEVDQAFTNTVTLIEEIAHSARMS